MGAKEWIRNHQTNSKTRVKKIALSERIFLGLNSYDEE
jgi:hypothetical protein